jgi:hypothetical protein
MSKSILTAQIEQVILLIRGQKVILDADLAKLYGVTTKRFNGEKGTLRFLSLMRQEEKKGHSCF